MASDANSSWHIDEASRNPQGPMRVYLGRGESEAAEAEYEVIWHRGHAHVAILRCTSLDAEVWLLSAEAERELLAIWRKRSVAEPAPKPLARRSAKSRATLTVHVLSAAMAATGCSSVYKLELASGASNGLLTKPRSDYGISLGVIERVARSCGLKPSELLARAEALAEKEGGK